MRHNIVKFYVHVFSLTFLHTLPFKTAITTKKRNKLIIKQTNMSNRYLYDSVTENCVIYKATYICQYNKRQYKHISNTYLFMYFVYNSPPPIRMLIIFYFYNGNPVMLTMLLGDRNMYTLCNKIFATKYA